MILFIVIGICWNEESTILGIYDLKEIAIKRKIKSENPLTYDEIVIREIELNQDIDDS